MRSASAASSLRRTETYAWLTSRVSSVRDSTSASGSLDSCPSAACSFLPRGSRSSKLASPPPWCGWRRSTRRRSRRCGRRPRARPGRRRRPSRPACPAERSRTARPLRPMAGDGRGGRDRAAAVPAAASGVRRGRLGHRRRRLARGGVEPPGRRLRCWRKRSSPRSLYSIQRSEAATSSASTAASPRRPRRRGRAGSTALGAPAGASPGRGICARRVVSAAANDALGRGASATSSVASSASSASSRRDRAGGVTRRSPRRSPRAPAPARGPAAHDGAWQAFPG